MATCPYCTYVLNEVPKRSKKCPSCGEMIFVKSTPVNREKRLMTAALAQEAESLWERYNARQAAVSILFPFGMTETDIEKQMREGAVSDRDAVRLILVKIAADTNNLHMRKMAYGRLAAFSEEEGQPFQELLMSSVKCELLQYRNMGVKRVEILTAGHRNACAACEVNKGKVFPIDEAIRLMPLPNSSCSRSIAGKVGGFCRCGYIPVVD